MLWILLAIQIPRSSSDNPALYVPSTCDFSKTVKSPNFVDKTLLIKDFFAPINYSIFVTAPSQFGKSTNMRMVKKFCELIVDADGHTVPREQTENYKLFTGKYKKAGVEDSLNVYKDREFFDKHFGEYPVIYLDFKNINCSTFGEFLNGAFKIVNREFVRHKYLRKSKSVDCNQKDKFDMFYDMEHLIETPPTIIQHSVDELARTMHMHFNKKVVVLLDEFDAPLRDAIFNNASDETISLFIRFGVKLTEYFLKSHPSVERALINSRLRVGQLLTSDEIKMKHYYFPFKHPFNEYYGMTENEVVGLAKAQEVEENLDLIRRTYGGYRAFGSSVRMYNIYSMVNYLHFKQVKKYWAVTDDYINIKRACFWIVIYNDIFRLNKENYTLVNTIQEFNLEHIYFLRNLLGSGKYIFVNQTNADWYMHMLMDYGYVTITDKYLAQSGREKYELIWPNIEIKLELDDTIKEVRFLAQKDFPYCRITTVPPFELPDDWVDSTY